METGFTSSAATGQDGLTYVIGWNQSARMTSSTVLRYMDFTAAWK